MLVVVGREGEKDFTDIVTTSGAIVITGITRIVVLTTNGPLVNVKTAHKYQHNVSLLFLDASLVILRVTCTNLVRAHKCNQTSNQLPPVPH